MSDTRKSYPFDAIEAKWQAFWEENATFAIPNPGEPGFDASKPTFFSVSIRTSYWQIPVCGVTTVIVTMPLVES